GVGGVGFCFFFSSRRRHTRWPRDWSSDVCSSDLIGNRAHGRKRRHAAVLREALEREGLSFAHRAAELSEIGVEPVVVGAHRREQDRKSTRLNSSHVAISYAVFCLKKKK